jgi:hypothetical protein
VKRFEGTDVASASGLRRKKSIVGARLSQFISAGGRRLPACKRTDKATDLVRITVKSFVALSVRVRSSGNSPAIIPHNSSTITAVTRILLRPVHPRAMLSPPVQDLEIFWGSGLITLRADLRVDRFSIPI